MSLPTINTTSQLIDLIMYCKASYIHDEGKEPTGIIMTYENLKLLSLTVIEVTQSKAKIIFGLTIYVSQDVEDVRVFR